MATRSFLVAAVAGASWSTKLAGLLGVFCIVSIVLREIAAMRFPLEIGFLAALAIFTGHGSAVITSDLGWFPPNATTINNLTDVLTATGVYGFVFNNSYPTGIPYGTYNWCNMPHVRKEEYVKPSNEYTLKFVELVHRHHKRTVYASNSFPVESYGWDCNDEGLYFYGAPMPGNDSSRAYWQGYMSAINPFVPTGFLGTCQFPQITSEGLNDAWQHGKDLIGVYHNVMGFLPDDMSGKVQFRVTQNTITTETAGMIFNGMFDTKGNVAMRVEPDGYDSLEPTYTCDTAATIYDSQETTSAWVNHLAAASSLYAKLDNISGVDTTSSDWHDSFDHYYDNLSARQCHAKPLPCKLIDGANSTTCVTQSMADEVYRFGNWEYSYIYRDNPQSLDAAVGSFGVWIAEMEHHIREVLAGDTEIIYYHNVAHDGSVSRLLSVLQVDVMVWPGMGSEVVFEVYEGPILASNPSGHYMRVLWGGRVLRSSSPMLGLMDMVPLDTVLAYFDGLVGVNAGVIVGKCNGTISYQIRR